MSNALVTKKRASIARGVRGARMPDLRPLDFYAELPVPLRLPFADAVEKTARTHDLRCHVQRGAQWPAMPLGASAPLSFATALDAGHAGSFLESAFEESACRRAGDYHPAFTSAGLADPAGVVHVLAAIPYVIVADERKLGARPAPAGWADLLDPAYRGEILIGGMREPDGSSFAELNRYVLGCFSSDFGDAATARLAGNVRGVRHHLEIVHDMRSRSAGALAILPWMQAEMCVRSGLSVIWPEEGAYALPIVFAMRSGARERLAPILRLLDGGDLGAMLNRNCYPPALRGHSAQLPSGARLRWPGWPAARSGALLRSMSRASQVFEDHWSPIRETCVCA